MACGTLIGCALLAGPAEAAIQASFNCTDNCELTPGGTATFVSTSTSSASITGYAWDLDGDGLYGVEDEPDEPDGAGARSAQRAFPAAGTFEVGLRVRNAARETSVARRTVRVTAPPEPPAPPPPPTAQPPAFVPPAALGDGDGDRVSNERDLCPGSAPVMRARLHGCSVLDAMVSPAALLTSVAGATGDATRALRRVPHAKRSRARLTDASDLLARAADRLALNPCRAASMAARGLHAADRGLEGAGKAVTKAQDALILRASRSWRRRRGSAAGDADGFDVAYVRLSLKRRLARSARTAVAQLKGLMVDACEAAKRRTRVRARVLELDPAAGVARLSDGTRLAYGAASRASGVAQGSIVAASGVLLEGKVLVADAIKGSDLSTKLPLVPCTFTPRIAPVQDFAQGNDEILYYDVRGYRAADGAYQLEEGMGLGAVRGPTCTKDDYALNVYLDYTNVHGSAVNKLLGVLRGVAGFEPPLRIPMDVGKTKAKLRFELWGLDCEQPKDVTVCGDKQLQSKTSAAAAVRRQGAWGTAVYDRAIFSVEDGSDTDFDAATLLGAATGLPGASVFGVGYAIGGGASQRPVRSYILEGQQFAVHDDVPSQADPSGLLWAYINGTRNGHPYHYVARLPKLVTDVVSFCPGTGASFYRLPWKADTLELVGQANNSEPTHSGGQKYAFDFRMPLLRFGYATRGGVVTLVEEHRTKQSNPKAVEYWKKVTGGKLNLWQPGNTLLIRHQDGSTSLYTHMVPAGVFPEEGDVVERGDRIIVVGATGNVTGPHLHYHVTSTGDDENAALGNTIPIRFEVAPLVNTPIPCVVPTKGQVWMSTNRKPAS